MGEIFSNELISSQEDDGYYTPEKLSELKLIFERACLLAGMPPKVGLQRDEMAMLILVGSSDEEFNRVLSALLQDGAMQPKRNAVLSMGFCHQP